VSEPENLLIAALFVALGGAVGALLRFGVYEIIDSHDFPWATLSVNVIGCFLAAFLMFGFGEVIPYGMKNFLFVGVFGAFTTMSAMSLDTLNLINSGSHLLAASNAVLNVILCVLGAVAGSALANAVIA
jgi:CrcB protein